MKNSRVKIKDLDEVINSTIEAIEKGQKQIYGIFEHAKSECDRISRELDILKSSVKETIVKVDNLTKQERASRYRLMLVSKEISKYSEEDIKAAYEEAKEIQLQLIIERQKEKQLREKRDDLERSLKGMLKILKESEHLIMQLGVALGFLKGNLKDISGQISDINARKSLAAQIIRAQEEERRRVAREIHDGPAQTLANIVIQMEICERLLEKDLNEAKKELAELKGIVRLSLKELRKIIFNLRPSSLDDLGLVALTQRYCHEFQESTGIKTNFKFFGNKIRLDSDIEITIFRIIQEALTNVKKHSKAKNCDVKLEFGDKKVNLIIADDGIGFKKDPEENLSNGEHFGILTMKERVSLLGGTFNIESAPKVGTKIFTAIPYEAMKGGKGFGEDQSSVGR